jgi:hypothetical protein
MYKEMTKEQEGRKEGRKTPTLKIQGCTVII